MARFKAPFSLVLGSNTVRRKDIRQIWVAYKETSTTELRNVLMENYLPLVRYNAERIHTKLPEEVDVEDLVSAGIFGLMDAIDAFDLGRQVKFETYCAPRIRGAILDELREMDWVPRLVRSRSSQVGKASRDLEMLLGRPPTDEELAVKIGVDEDEFAKIRKDSGAVKWSSLSCKWFETDSNKEVRTGDVIEDKSQVSPLTTVQHKDFVAFITEGLSYDEKMIVICYYYEQMTMKEIGTVLGLSESRVSQMHSSIVLRLKARVSVGSFG